MSPAHSPSVPVAPAAVVVTAEHPAAIKHMEILQAIIARMAGNSAACKQWSIPLVAGMLAFAVDKHAPLLSGLAMLPVLIFYGLDTYYLMLENRFRERFNRTAAQLAGGQFTAAGLFVIQPAGATGALWRKALRSPSTWPVYLGLTLAVLAAGYLSCRGGAG